MMEAIYEAKWSILGDPDIQGYKIIATPSDCDDPNTYQWEIVHAYTGQSINSTIMKRPDFISETLGDEVLVNGNFTGDASGWILTGWALTDNAIQHIAD